MEMFLTSSHQTVNRNVADTNLSESETTSYGYNTIEEKLHIYGNTILDKPHDYDTTILDKPHDYDTTILDKSHDYDTTILDKSHDYDTTIVDKSQTYETVLYKPNGYESGDKRNSCTQQFSRNGAGQPSANMCPLQRQIRALFILYTILTAVFISFAIFCFLFMTGRMFYANCLREQDISEYKKIWMATEHRRSDDGTNVCFKSMSWIVQIVSTNDNALYDRKNYSVLSSMGQPSVQNVNQRPFAHLFLKASAKYTDQEKLGPLKWNSPGIDGSEVRSMAVDASKGEIRIRQSGFYFLYSHVMYKSQRLNESSDGYNRRRPAHFIFKNYKADGRTKLLESVGDSQNPTSFLQGIFFLQADDVLVVCTAVDLLYGDTGRFSYFGAYLI